MNFPRYVVAGGVSLALHAAFMLVAKQSTALAMPAGNQSTSVAINFVAAPQPAPQQAKERVVEKTVPDKTTPQTAPEPAPAPPAKVVKHTAVPKAMPKATPKVTPKRVKPTPSKPTADTVAKSTDPIATPAPKPEPVKPKPAANPVEPVAASKPTPIVSSQGANATPMMVDRPSFVSRPVRPSYPRLAQKRGIEGVATYEVWLDEHGRQIKQILISSSGTAMLDQSALDAIKQWKFSPHIINGEALAHRVQIPVRFRLDG